MKLRHNLNQMKIDWPPRGPREPEIVDPCPEERQEGCYQWPLFYSCTQYGFVHFQIHVLLLVGHVYIYMYVVRTIV